MIMKGTYHQVNYLSIMYVDVKATVSIIDGAYMNGLSRIKARESGLVKA